MDWKAEPLTVTLPFVPLTIISWTRPDTPRSVMDMGRFMSGDSSMDLMRPTPLPAALSLAAICSGVVVTDQRYPGMASLASRTPRR